MLAVFLVLFFGETVQAMPSGAEETVGTRAGVGAVPASGITLAVALLILLLAGVYYVTARKDGVTFREAVFNWPLVILAGIATLLSLL
jgi:EamA domain-containing membrane protein RarD